MEQPAAGKWKVVDTSSYIWATSGGSSSIDRCLYPSLLYRVRARIPRVNARIASGGAAPMKTQWGNLGATAMAPTLNAQVSEGNEGGIGCGIHQSSA
jgi:hypothetical protein